MNLKTHASEACSISKQPHYRARAQHDDPSQPLSQDIKISSTSELSIKVIAYSGAAALIIVSGLSFRRPIIKLRTNATQVVPAIYPS